MKITYRKAKADDWPNIAALHLSSWQENYRGSFSDHYLDHEAPEERAKVWQLRFEQPKENQYVLLAEEKSNLIGFACTYGAHDIEHGSLLDNLHVIKNARGHGVGAELLRDSAKWAFTYYPEHVFYLYVLLVNERGIAFYKSMGAQLSPPLHSQTPDGGQSKVLMCSWPNVNAVQ